MAQTVSTLQNEYDLRKSKIPPPHPRLTRAGFLLSNLTSETRNSNLDYRSGEGDQRDESGLIGLLINSAEIMAWRGWPASVRSGLQIRFALLRVTEAIDRGHRPCRKQGEAPSRSPAWRVSWHRPAPGEEAWDHCLGLRGPSAKVLVQRLGGLPAAVEVPREPPSVD